MASLESVESVEMSQNKTDDEFQTVSRQSRKRKQTASSMDTSDIEMKRPFLPPISGDKLKVLPCGIGKAVDKQLYIICTIRILYV